MTFPVLYQFNQSQFTMDELPLFRGSETDGQMFLFYAFIAFIGPDITFKTAVSPKCQIFEFVLMQF